MSLDLERALQRAADGPTPTLDISRVHDRGMRRRRILQAGAATGAVAVLAGVAVAVGSTLPTVRPIVGSIDEEPPAVIDGAVAEDTAAGFVAVRLGILPTTVPAGHVPDTVLVNDGDVVLSATPQCSLDRWIEGTWIDLGQQRFDPPYGIAPGEAGPWQSCLTGTSLDQPEPGRYRVRWQVTAGDPGPDQPRITVGGEFEIVASDLADTVAPLPTGTRPAPPDALTDGLVEAMELGDDDTALLIPVPGTNRSITMRERDGAWPLLAATSCDALATLRLPQGWSGLCLERSFHGERLTGRYPYGTTSVGLPGPATLCGDVGWDRGRLPTSRDPCVPPPRKRIEPGVGWQ